MQKNAIDNFILCGVISAAIAVWRREDCQD
jgi:hypothetical protein